MNQKGETSVAKADKMTWRTPILSQVGQMVRVVRGGGSKASKPSDGGDVKKVLGT